jgi:alpha-ketoglutarate-dependent 2,4-dichlorophenoxyacetate dioxygenase
MAINLFPVTPGFVTEIGDVDLSEPLSDEDAAAIDAAFLKYAVLVFPAQRLSPDQHVAFAERFGPLEPNINTYQDEVKADRIDSRISDVSNLDHENLLLPAHSRKRLSGLANRLWHTDSIFRHVPARASLLYARIVAPIGGLTEFADMRAAWDALPESMRRQLDGQIVEHSIFHSRAKVGATEFTDRERASLPPSKQVLVRTIPETGRRALYLASHAIRRPRALG